MMSKMKMKQLKMKFKKKNKIETPEISETPEESEKDR